MDSLIDLRAEEYVALLANSNGSEELSAMSGVTSVQVDWSEFSYAPDATEFATATDVFTTLPCVVVGTGTPAISGSTAIADLSDVVVSSAELDTFGAGLHRSLSATPYAAVTLAVLLRGSAKRTIAEGLVAESVLYSLLQSGAEFQSWLASRPDAALTPDQGVAVLVERIDDRLLVALNRPHRHNAFSSAMRDSLCEALELGSLDPSIGVIELTGRGPSFCSGGELAQFGTFATPVESHLTRLTRSPARLLAGLAAKATVHLHGACYGAGIELPAFARHVTADVGTRIKLPEIGLGLIPGAGGTVSLPGRIGRHRTALLALSQEVITAETALDWGLIDAIENRPSESRPSKNRPPTAA